MQSLLLAKHRLGDAYRSVASSVMPVSTESKFVESGMLTPEEFLEAGDQLTFKFPTWQWTAGEPGRRVSHLPEDRQFLITRNVPCKDRVRALDGLLEQTKTVDDWLLPETANPDGGDGEADAEIRDIDDLAADRGGPVIVAQDDFIGASPQRGEGSGLPDFSDLDAALAEEDPASLVAGGSSGSADAPGRYLVAEAPDAHVLRMRTYDLSITYDKYYKTPRLWLFGYNEIGEPLGPEDVYEDVLSEYVSKTVTVDPHPLTGTPTVSIHPCRHAQVMKKVIDDWIEQGIEPRHDLALFVFLKFISGVVPTINYDFTMDIEF